MTLTGDRRGLLRLVIGGAGFLGGCGFGSRAKGGEFVEDIRQAWNSPENEAAARQRPSPIHVGDPYSARPSLSADGNLAAVALPSSAVNEIAVIDLRARRGWRIVHPNRRVKLTQPAFSPDGSSLAVVVTPPTYYGASEIWLTTPQGGPARVLRDAPSGCFLFPTFSNDGSKVACFAEADDPRADDGPSWARTYRTGLVHFCIAEIDLATGAKVRYAPPAWSTVSFLAYDSQENGFIVSTGLPSIRQRAEDGQMRWTRDIGAITNAQRHEGFLAYHLSRGEQLGTVPQSVIPASVADPDSDGRRGVALQGVDRDGRLLVRCSRRNERSPFGMSASLVLVADGSASDVIAPTDNFIQEGAISRSGAVAIGRATWRFDGQNSAMRAPTTSDYFINGIARELLHINFDSDITFEREQRLLIASDPSEMAQ